MHKKISDNGFDMICQNISERKRNDRKKIEKG